MSTDPAGTWEGYPQVGSGWPFPVRWDHDDEPDPTPGLRSSRGERRIAEALTLVLRTALGERVMRPTFGAGVDRYVFDPRTDEVCRRLEQDVRRALLLAEPRVLVDRVEAVLAGADDRIDVHLDYRIDRHRRPESLVLPFHVAGGDR
ncbi:GPW/gp25 family protein [Nocardioides sp. cx-169]|uniref:GPW/gp25 family protein n=1 Tax=Nocardioides sp. cx-169 TaxID=2899080 RepID=UPI001E5FBCE6|nr:GPW/gp25 family protein [Nocardioides sp. cx-169]MCD4536374.1 GPW/gp25 family protein [Nocardioides sp. cx-169]